jgi:hypothetical protein
MLDDQTHNCTLHSLFVLIQLLRWRWVLALMLVCACVTDWLLLQLDWLFTMQRAFITHRACVCILTYFLTVCPLCSAATAITNAAVFNCLPWKGAWCFDACDVCMWLLQALLDLLSVGTTCTTHTRDGENSLLMDDVTRERRAWHAMRGSFLWQQHGNNENSISPLPLIICHGSG